MALEGGGNGRPAPAWDRRQLAGDPGAVVDPLGNMKIAGFGNGLNLRMPDPTEYSQFANLQDVQNENLNLQRAQAARGEAGQFANRAGVAGSYTPNYGNEMSQFANRAGADRGIGWAQNEGAQFANRRNAYAGQLQPRDWSDGSEDSGRRANMSALAAARAAGYEVQEGDNLWNIAAEQLGPNASPADIAEFSSAIYLANQDTIGSNPDLIHAGQRFNWS